ncbi:MAG: ATP-binding protein [Pseudomonadota bacterium]
MDERHRASEARLWAFIEQAPVSIAMFDRNMCYLAASSRWLRDYHLPPDLDLIGRSHYEVFPEIPERWKAVHRRGMAGEILSHEEDPFVRSEGATQWVKWEVRPWLTDAGEIGGILILTEDVTERVLARQALQESRADLNRAQAVGQIGSWRLDVGRNVLTWSEENHRIFGIPEGTPLTYETFLDSVHPDDRDYVNSKWLAALDGEPYDIEHRIVVDGQVKWVREKAYLEHDDNGRLSGGFGITQDITGRKLAALALVDADRHKNEFLAMLAHELRNPLATIRNAAQVVCQTHAQNATLAHAAGMIERQVEHLVQLVDDLLDISRVSRGKIKLRKARFNLSTIIHQAVETALPFIESRGHRLEVTMPQRPIRVEGDAARLTQVIGNLLSNAAKYTDYGGTLHLTGEHVAPAAGADAVLIRVQDNGRGIEADALPNLFDLFFQGERNLDRTEGGLGIGLALVKLLVELHDGRVEAHSAGLGKGSEFIVHLPCLPEAIPAPAATATPPELAVTGRRVLLVDDNRDVAASLSLLLGLAGHDVTTVHDGRQAIDTALREHPDVVLLDIGLPALNGYQVCRALRDAGLTETLIVGITGYGRDEDRAQARDAGFDLHMTKPVAPQAVVELLSRPPAR